MIKSIDSYLGKRFNERKYNCWDFAREVWKDMTGEDLYDKVDLTPNSKISKVEAGTAINLCGHKFTKLDAPAEPCLVFMERANILPHVGVYIRGRVLSIDMRGVSHLPVPVASMGFTSVGFYL